MSKSNSYSLHTLKNGLRVVLAPRNSTRAVTVMVGYKVGSRDELARLNGVAHFIEHLMFKGSKKFPKAVDVSKKLDSLGAEYNAFTSKDMTAYYIKVAADKIAIALEILSDILIQPLFAKTEIERERGVIIEEINMYQDNPRSIASELVEGSIYQGHPLAREVIGTKQIIKSVSRAQLLDFKKRHYTVGNAVVSIAGNIKPREVVKLCEKYFKHHNRRLTTDPSAAQKRSFGGRGDKRLFKGKQNEARVKVKTKPTEQLHLALGLPALPDSDKRLPVLKLLSAILGAGMSSRLFVELREKRGLCYYVSASLGTFQETGDFVIRAGLPAAKTAEALQVIMRELKKLKTRPVTQSELQRAKDLVQGTTVLAQEHSEYLADFYAKEVLYRDSVLTPEQKLKILSRVRAAEIRQLAQELLLDTKLNLAMVSPLKSGQAAEFMPLLRL